MTIIRSLLFLVGMTVWTILMGLICVPALIGPERWAQAAVLAWSRGAVGWARMAAGIKFRVRGLDNIPAGPAIIAAKHQSAWETFALLTLLPDTRVVMKRSILLIPFIGWYLFAAGHLPIDRSGNARALRVMLARVQRLKARNLRLLIFPEGTRVAPGAAPKLLVGALALAKLARLPIVPVALNSGLLWQRNGFLKFPGTIDVLVLPPLAAGMEKTAQLDALHLAINVDPRAGAASPC